jgi:hypothetical protein
MNKYQDIFANDNNELNDDYDLAPSSTYWRLIFIAWALFWAIIVVGTVLVTGVLK